MSNTPTAKPPVWFWVIGGVAVVWNALGVMAFIMQTTMSPDALAALPEKERALYETFPIWALIAFAAAVFGGLGGSIALLLRRSLASTLFIVSLIGVVIQMAYNFLIAETMDVYGPGAAVMPAMVLLFAIFLLWFANSAKSKGWLT